MSSAQSRTPDIYIRIWICCIQYSGWYRCFVLQCTCMNLWLRYNTRYRSRYRGKKLRYRWSKTLGLEPPPNVVPDIEVNTRYRSLRLWYWGLDFDIGCGKDPWIGASSEYRTLCRRFLLLDRSHYFNIKVYDFPISRNHKKMASISKSKTSISMSKPCCWY